MLGDPVKRVQVAQAALAVLDVRLDPVARSAGALVPLIALFKLGGDEFPVPAREHLLAELRLESAAKAPRRRG